MEPVQSRKFLMEPVQCREIINGTCAIQETGNGTLAIVNGTCAIQGIFFCGRGCQALAQSAGVQTTPLGVWMWHWGPWLVLTVVMVGLDDLRGLFPNYSGILGSFY